LQDGSGSKHIIGALAAQSCFRDRASVQLSVVLVPHVTKWHDHKARLVGFRVFHLESVWIAQSVCNLITLLDDITSAGVGFVSLCSIWHREIRSECALEIAQDLALPPGGTQGRFARDDERGSGNRTVRPPCGLELSGQVLNGASEADTEVRVGRTTPDAIRRLKNEVDGDLYVSGSGTLIRTMLADGLVDALHLADME
jgi:RibD C-terminal domain